MKLQRVTVHNYIAKLLRDDDKSRGFFVTEPWQVAVIAFSEQLLERALFRIPTELEDAA